MKIVITESQFENVRRQTTGLVILNESHDKYKDILSDEELDEIILSYKGKPLQKFRDEQSKIYNRFKMRGPCLDINGNRVLCKSKERVKNTQQYLNLLTKDMTRVANLFSDEELETAAKKYQNVSDFRDNDKNKEQQARRRGEEFWNRVTAHMTPKGSYGNKMVYVYEFTEKDENGNDVPVAAYVGLTGNIKQRREEHEKGIDRFGRVKDSSVTKFLKANPGTTFYFKELTNGYIPYVEAQELENKFENEYRNTGWLILNIAKPGSLGATFGISDEEIKNQIDQYTDYSEYIQNHSLVNRVKRRGLKHLTKNLKRDREYRTDKEIIDFAMTYDNYTDFMNDAKKTVWQAAYKRGLLDIIKEKFKEKKENINL
jgi:hypothetical protein